MSLAWKMATIKLVPKPAAAQEPTSPSNFRPIALTSCVSKIFPASMARVHAPQWLHESQHPKTFLPSTPGCTEHHSKIAGVLSDIATNHF